MGDEPSFRFLAEDDIGPVMGLVAAYSMELSRVPLDGAHAREYRRYLETTPGDPGHFVVLAVVDGRIAGFADYRVERGRQDSRVMYGSIDEFYVAPPHRRGGLGDAWPGRRSITCALGADLVELSVLRTNASGERFWNSLGFRDRAVRKRLCL